MSSLVYRCAICPYDFENVSGLRTHCQTKKHEKNKRCESNEHILQIICKKSQKFLQITESEIFVIQGKSLILNRKKLKEIREKITEEENIVMTPYGEEDLYPRGFYNLPVGDISLTFEYAFHPFPPPSGSHHYASIPVGENQTLFFSLNPGSESVAV